MRRLLNLASALLVSVRAKDVNVLLQEARGRFHSNRVHYGLRRDLRVPFAAPVARIPLKIRPLQDSDMPVLLAMDENQMSAKGPYVRMHRLNFVREDIGQCYVATTDGDEPCYMQWLLSAGENPAIKRYFKGIFPELGVNEALLEYAFTREGYQGNGIMPAAMAQIAESATKIGADYVITFVDNDNIPALKGCQRSGFRPYVVRTDRWRFFRRNVTFEPLPPGAPYPFEREPVADVATSWSCF